MKNEILHRPFVIIADWRSESESLSIAADDLDLYTKEELDEIVLAINEVCCNVTLYSCPKDFIDNIKLHNNAVVLPFWSGKKSRNRTALLSAISEAYHLDYFGADTYAYILGQDKAISKHLATEYEIKTPTFVLIRDAAQINLVDTLEPPIVVKPNLQGSSIGISEKSLCYTINEAKSQVMKLLSEFKEPVLVEKFIEGLEVTVTIWGNADGIKLFQAVEIYEPTGMIDFSKTIWSFELKKSTSRPIKAQRGIKLSQKDEIRLRQLFSDMGKIELVRIDGRLREGEFYFLEMNPEPYLGIIGSVSKSFSLQGYEYKQMFYQLFCSFDIIP